MVEIRPDLYPTRSKFQPTMAQQLRPVRHKVHPPPAAHPLSPWLRRPPSASECKPLKRPFDRQISSSRSNNNNNNNKILSPTMTAWHPASVTIAAPAGDTPHHRPPPLFRRSLRSSPQRFKISNVKSRSYNRPFSNNNTQLDHPTMAVLRPLRLSTACTLATEFWGPIRTPDLSATALCLIQRPWPPPLLQCHRSSSTNTPPCSTNWIAP